MAQLSSQLLEEFALLKDSAARESYLSRLVPGSQEHFILAWLAAEQAGFPRHLEGLLESWANNNPHSDLTQHYKNRRKFIEAASDSKDGDALNEDIKSWLQDKLGLYFYHGKEDMDGSSAILLPSEVPQSTLDTLTEDALVARELGSIGYSDSVFGRLDASATGSLDHPKILERFCTDLPFAYQYISAGPGEGNLTGVPQALSDDKLCSTLSKLYNDASIRSSYSYYFEGRFTERVFPNLTLAQLQRLGGCGAANRPTTDAEKEACKKFVENCSWGGAMVARMAPQRTVDFRADRDAKTAYLAALKAFCDGSGSGEQAGDVKPASYNPLRHAVLYHLLEDARLRLGRRAFSFAYEDPSADAEASRNRALLLEFVKVPRNASAATSTWLRYRDSDSYQVTFWKDVMRAMSYESASSPGYAIVNPDSPNTAARELLKAFALPLPNANQDNDLIVAALSDIFASAAGAPAGGNTDEDRNGGLSPWSEFMSSEWLKRIQAEARLTRGRAEDRGSAAAQWVGGLGSGSSSAGSAALQSLKDKVELVLPSWNKEYYGPADPVTVSLVAKGVQSLDVRVFEINTTSYYSEKLSEIPSDIALDGLHAHEAFTVDVAATASGSSEPWSPIRRYDVTLSFDSLKSAAQRGVFVIEVTGAGVSVRAVVRKGSLRLVERKTVSGHILHVLGEDNSPLPADKVSVTLAGRKYTPAASAAIAGVASPSPSSATSGILIPYGATASRQPLIITVSGSADAASAGSEEQVDWSFSTLQAGWEHAAESYRLEASFALEREQLLKDNYEAKLLVRPRLLLHGSIPAPLGTLVNVSLTLTSTDADGSNSTKLIKPFVLANNKESVATFPVPPSLRRLRAKLSGDYEIMSNGERVTLSAEHEVSLNQIDSSDTTRHVHLRQTAEGGYAIYCLGKSGEPVARQQLTVNLVERVTKGYHGTGPSISLCTDGEGKVVLGKLPPTVKLIRVDGIQRQATPSASSSYGGSSSAGTTSAYFELPQELLTYDPVVHTVAPINATAGAGGEAAVPQLSLPFRPSSAPYSAVDPRDISIVEVRPLPTPDNSIATGGNGGRDAEESSMVVRDMLKETSASGAGAFVRYDAALGYLVVQNLPAGEYRVTVKRPFPGSLTPGRTVKVVVLPAETAKVVGSGWLASGSTLLQLKGAAGVAADGCPVNISSCSGAVGNDHLTVRVSGGAKGLAPAGASDVRLHVIAATFVPATSSDVGLSLARNLSLSGLSSSRYGPTRSRYLESRVLGEETRYVLERQKLLQGPADKQPLPGNALPRPQLLLNPWSLGPADSGTQEAKGGTAYASHADATASRAVGARAAASGVGDGDYNARNYAAIGNLDFLAAPARVLANLAVAGANGEVKVSVKDLLAAANASAATAGRVVSLYLTLVAADSSSTASTHVSVYVDASSGKIAAVPTGPAATSAFPAIETRDLSVPRTGIAADDHVIQSSRITLLSPPDESLTVSASATHTKVESYGSIDRVFSLFMAQSNNAQLSADWSWLMSWPVLSSTEKKSRYSKYACHELHLFLYFKDQDFFNAVVRPFLSCKRSKTFIDHWVLGHDMTAYTSVNAFMRLNALEKALLAARVSDAANNGQGATLRKAIAEELEAVVSHSPLNPSQKEGIFKAALASSGLDANGPQGGAALQALLKRAEAEKATVLEAAMASKKAAAAAMRDVPKPNAPRALNEMVMAQASVSKSVAPMGFARRAGPSAGGGGGAIGGLMRSSLAMAAPSMAAPCPPPPGAAMRTSEGISLERNMMMDEAALDYDDAPMAKESSKRKKSGAQAKGRGGMFKRRESPEQEEELSGAGFDESDGDDDAYGGGEADKEMAAEEEEGDIDDADLALRSQARDRALYRPLDKTEEFAEHQYYRVNPMLEEDTCNLVTANEFIADFAQYCARIGALASRLGAGSTVCKVNPSTGAVEDPVALAIKQAGGFATANIGVVAAATSLPTRYPVRDGVVPVPSTTRFLLNQMLLALAVLGLPFEASPDAAPAAPNVSLLPNGGGLKFGSGGTPLIVFNQDLSSSSSSASTGATTAEGGSVILCGQSYFDPFDREETIRGQTREKYLKPSTSTSAGGDSSYATFSMLRGKVYGTACVVTNISSTDLNVDILVHLPQGAMSVSNHKVLKTTTLRLSPFSTHRLEYTFYLPHLGSYDHFPVHVSKAGGNDSTEGGGSSLLAYAAPTSIRVVEGNDANAIDTASWFYVSQMGSLQEVLARLATCNVKQTDFEKILWRCRESPEDWFAIIDALKSRHVFSDQVWSYGLHHGITWAVKEYLRHPDIVSRISHYFGPLPLLVSPLITTSGELWVAGGDAGSEAAPAADAAAATGSVLQANRDSYINLGDGIAGGYGAGDVANYYYEHLEYSPLVNARAHVLGEKRTIVNRAVLKQWRNLLAVLACKKPEDVTAADELALVYFFLLLDRVPEARARFALIKAPATSVAARFAPQQAQARSSVADKEPFMALQHDYCAAYLDLFNGPIESEEPITDTDKVFPVASAVAAAYASYPVPKWAAKFREIGSLLRSIKAMSTPGALSPTSADVHSSAALGSGLSAEEVGLSKELTREQQNTLASAMEPLLGLKTRGSNIVVSYNRALGSRVNVAAYAMDVELLFSNAPFSINGGATGGSDKGALSSLGSFAYVRPNSTIKIVLEQGAGGASAAGASSDSTPFAAPSQELVCPLPPKLAKKNVLLVATSAAHPSLRAVQPYFANELSVTLSEAFGRIKVAHSGTGSALPRVYVKVYYSSGPGDVKGKFFKDGYTTANGVFDYAAISTDELSSGKVKKFAILVMSDEYGSQVLTANPPKA